MSLKGGFTPAKFAAKFGPHIKSVTFDPDDEIACTDNSGTMCEINSFMAKIRDVTNKTSEFVIPDIPLDVSLLHPARAWCMGFQVVGTHVRWLDGLSKGLCAEHQQTGGAWGEWPSPKEAAP